MDKYERSLAAIEELFANTTAEEFERDYLKAKANSDPNSETIEAYLNRTTTKRHMTSG